MIQPESGRLSLADIITIADDVSRVTSRITDDGRIVLGGVLEQMEEMANKQGRMAVVAYRDTRRNLEAEWVTAESVVDDTMNECNRAIHTFVTQAGFQIRHFENELRRQIRNKPFEECDQQPRMEVDKAREDLDDDE